MGGYRSGDRGPLLVNTRPPAGAGGRRGAYSWAGICCSMSRQALILRRRQTQQSGSEPVPGASAPHTVHLESFFNRSGKAERLACSRSSAGTMGATFGWIFRRIKPHSTIAETLLQNKPHAVLSVLRRLRNLNDHGHIQGRPAPGALLSGGHAQSFTAQFQIGCHRMGTHRAVNSAGFSILHECFHVVSLTTSSDANQFRTVVPNS